MAAMKRNSPIRLDYATPKKTGSRWSFTPIVGAVFLLLWVLGMIYVNIYGS